MKCEWEEFKLGDVTGWYSGGTPSKSKDDFWSGDIPWISASSMNGNRYYDSENKISLAGLNAGSRLAEKDSILLLVRGSILHQKIPVGIAERNLAFNQDVKAIKVKEEFLYPRFLLIWFMAHEKKLLKMVENTGIGAGKLDTKQLQNLIIRIPPKEIQQRLVFFSKNLDDKITLNTQTNQTLEALAQALFKSWFVDFDPVKAKQQGGDLDAIAEQLGLSREILDLFPDELVESELGWIPKGWEVVGLREFGEIICGKTPSKKIDSYYGCEIPFIKIPDMHNNTFVIETNEYLSYEGAKSQKNKEIPEGSICVSCIATVGKVSITSRLCHTNQQINSIIPKLAPYTPYLYFRMLDSTKLLHDLASGGSATLNLNTGNFSKIKIIKPLDAITDAYYSKVGKMFSKILSNSEQNQTLTQLRDTLLPKLLSGEITIADVSASNPNETLNDGSDHA